MSLSDQIKALLDQQKSEWGLLRGNHDALAGVRTREFDLGGFEVRAQFNPARIASTAAKVDEKSVRERRCFLCRHNLPPEQRGLPFDDTFTILANPFPIFDQHFTVPHVDHVPQRIRSHFPTLLSIANATAGSYLAFYNGPRCGASAPDHLHFQLAGIGALPIQVQFDRIIERCGTLLCPGAARLYAVDRWFANFIALTGTDVAEMQRAFNRIHDVVGAQRGGDDEPMMNVLVWKNGASLKVVIIPRIAHRPDFYFAAGDDQLLLSPAAVDLGGICVLPRERDFERLTLQHLIRMRDQVCLTGEPWKAVLAKLSS